MKLFKTIILMLSYVTPVAFTTEFTGWDVPEEYQTMENTIELDEEESLDIWDMSCRSCHKDGMKYVDMTTEEFQNQSDGVLFYKTFEGKDGMPGYKKRLDKEEIWLVVNHMRTFK